MILATPLGRPIGEGVQYVAASPGLRRFTVLVCFVTLLQEIVRYTMVKLLPNGADFHNVALTFVVLFVVLLVSLLWRPIRVFGAQTIDSIARRKFAVAWCILCVALPFNALGDG